MENELQNSVQFLNRKLADNSPGFSVPSNYFDTLEDAIQAKIKEEKFSKTTGFQVSEDYFTTLENQIIHKIKPKKIHFLKRKKQQLITILAAASVILFVLISPYSFNFSSKQNNSQASDLEVSNWIDENITLINETDIIFAYNDIELNEFEGVPNSISDNEIENYLSYQDDISLIFENDY